jgi:hypothetical protein
VGRETPASEITAETLARAYPSRLAAAITPARRRFRWVLLRPLCNVAFMVQRPCLPQTVVVRLFAPLRYVHTG